MQSLPKRNLLGPSVALSDPVARCARAQIAVETLLAPQSDGVAAWLLRVPSRRVDPNPYLWV